MNSKHLKIRPEYSFLGKGVFGFVMLAGLWLLFGVYINAQKEAIAEAILLDKFKMTANATIFVSIDDNDPSDNFVRRLNSRNITVLKPSEGVAKNDAFGDSWGHYYVDKATGQKGKLTRIGKPGWVVPFFVWVGVSYPGNGESFNLRKSWRGWSVTNKRMSWIA